MIKKCKVRGYTSIDTARIEENFKVFDFELTTDEMNAINELNRNGRKGPHPNDMNNR